MFGIGQGERRDDELVLTVHMQRGTARDQNGEVRTTRQEIGQMWCCRQDLLEVVEEEQQVLVTEEGFQEGDERSSADLFDAKRLSSGRGDQGGRADGSQGDQRNPI